MFNTRAMRQDWLRNYHQSKDKVTGVAYAWGYSRGASAWYIEEALQEAWVKSWTQYWRFLHPRPNKASFATWVTTIYRNELNDLYRVRSKYYTVLPEADFSFSLEECDVEYNTEERQPDDTAVLDDLDEDVKVAALQVLRETGDLARGWQTRVAEKLGLSSMRITQILQQYRKAVQHGTTL